MTHKPNTKGLARGRLLVISGVPATGKSTYCEWLTGRGWRFINHDRAESAKREIDQTWWRLVTSDRAADFVPLVSAGTQDIALEFGFPIALLPQVRQLKAAGAQHWWFDADHHTAREAFIARNQEMARLGKRDRIVDIRFFDKYVNDIAARRDELHQLFEPKIIETVMLGGKYIPMKEIDRQVLAGSDWPDEVGD
jgi:hypothetical protein